MSKKTENETRRLVQLQPLVIRNTTEKSDWMNKRMKKGYSFKYHKGVVNNQKVNIAVECLDDGDVFMFEYASV